MSLFKKPNRKFRHRETREDSEEEDPPPCDKVENKPKAVSEISKPTITINISIPSNLSSSKDDKIEPSATPKVRNLLSFQDEEDEGETFKLKKSNYSRRLAKQRERERKKKGNNSSEASKKFDIPSIKPLPERKTDKSKDPYDIVSGKEAEQMELDSDDEEEKVNPFKSLLQSGVIPDAATIYAMKKHRQMAREMGDYIPVEDPEKDEDEKSRLIRDDDNDRSDEDDEPSRISFTVNTGAIERQKLRENFLSLQDASANDLEKEDAAELERWEREQIKKGVGVSTLDNSQSETQLYSSYAAANLNVPSSSMGNGVSQSARTVIPSQRMPSNLLQTSKNVNLTTADIRARIQERLETLQNIHKAHEMEYENCDKELSEAAELLETLAVERPQQARNYSLYQRMNGYISDLVECLDMKVAHIDLLDGRMVDLYEVRAQKLALRQQLDIRDQSDEYSTLCSEILRGVGIEFLIDKNVVTDDAKLRRAAEREGRRMRRRKHRERISISRSIKHQDGMSSDDEEADIDLINFKESREVILREAGTIFEDVLEEFGSLEGVMSSFEDWKHEHPVSYSEAYVPLCLPKIFGAFVKLALLDWNPLEEDRDLEQMPWFSKLVHYGLDTSVENESEKTEDPDYGLLPGVMDKVVLPKITSFVQKVWNPVSQRESSKLINLIKCLSANYPTVNGRSERLQNCFKAVVARIQKALCDNVFIPMYPKELLENRSLGASDFFQRQFWSSVKFLQNILMWNELIAELPLQQIAFASLLNRYILMGLNTSMVMKDTLEKCKVIVDSLPKVWFKGLKGGYTLPLLKPFSGFIVKFADFFYTQGLKKGVAIEEIKDSIKEMVQLLVVIESLDDAVAIAKKYSVSAFKNS